MRRITEIIVHCSATREGKYFTAEDIDRWHKAQGFACIGYHFVVRTDGRIEMGRGIERVGAHCKGHNGTSIGVCYVVSRETDSLRTPVRRSNARA